MEMLSTQDIAILVDEAGLAGVPLSLAVQVSAEAPSSYCRGVWADGRKIVPADRFYAASLAKQLTGAAVALLVRRGQIDIGTALGDYFPSLPDWRNAVSLRQLLHHTAGLPQAGVLESSIGSGHWTNARALALLRDLTTLPDRPGSAHRYSNVGYICLAEVVGNVSGVPFGQFVQDNAFSLLGIDAALLADDASLESYPQRPALGPVLPLSVGDGGLWISPENFVRWLQAQNDDVLGVEQLVERGARLDDGTTINYGWGIGLRTFMGRRLFRHGGSWQGATAVAARCPEVSACVAIFAAQSNAGLNGLVDAILHLILERVEARRP